MTFAIKEINQQSDLLPKLKLGFHIRDSCDDIPVSLRASFLLVNGKPEKSLKTESEENNESRGKSNALSCTAVNRTVSSVIIGDAGSGVSMALLQSLGSFSIPLVRLSDYLGHLDTDFKLGFYVKIIIMYLQRLNRTIKHAPV